MNNTQTHQLIQFDLLKPGVFLRVEHKGQGVLVCLADGTVYAVNDTCTHEDISLSLGALCEHRLRCPLHGSEFDIRTGEVLDEPAEENLPTYPVFVKDGWVCLD
jgi:nitrite reductase/ring-hydroxylating ferredoxin subunit